MLEDPTVRAARHDAREPDPGHPRDQPRHSPAAARCGWPTGARRRRLDIQTEYLNRALRYAETKGLSPLEEKQALEMWEHCLTAHRDGPARPRPRVSTGSSSTSSSRRYRDQARPAAQPPAGRADRPAVPRRQPRPRALLPACRTRGLVERICTDDDIDEAVETPPQTTRARLRGEFIRRAKERKRDYTVDWVHLKLNDQAQRTVLCKDPFKARDERVEKLIASL